MPIPKETTVTLPQRELLRDKVRKEILAAIMDGTLQPGEIISDLEMQQWLKVSRTPIRDALNELERAGLVEMQANRYTRVVNPNPDEVLESVQTLGVLLGGVVRLAVPRLSEQQRAELVAEINRASDALGAEDIITMNNVVIGAFYKFVALCGNSRLIRVCNETLDGLAFNLRVAHLDRILDFAFMKECFGRLRDATERGDGIAAELATEALHYLPGERTQVAAATQH